jgi:2-hydroxycyclohexanecarboxyl-CoA dehydrogenase
VELENKTFVVTGGASGIGRATALLLAREGAHVVIGDIDKRGGDAVVAEAEKGMITFVPIDLSDPASIGVFAETVLKSTPKIDGLVNAAGWDQVEPFMDNKPGLWDRLIAINLLGGFG